MTKYKINKLIDKSIRWLIMLSIGLILVSLLSCGARKTQHEKTKEEIKESISTNTKEQVKEVVTKEYDTTATTKQHEVKSEIDSKDFNEGKPLVYEDDKVKTETRYNKETGKVENKTTVKPQKVNIPVKETTERTINRDINKQEERESKKETKTKHTQREWVNWNRIIITTIGVILTILFLYWLIFVRRKSKQQ